MECAKSVLGLCAKKRTGFDAYKALDGFILGDFGRRMRHVPETSLTRHKGTCIRTFPIIQGLLNYLKRVYEVKCRH